MTERCSKYVLRVLREDAVATQRRAEELISRASKKGHFQLSRDLGSGAEHEIRVSSKTLGELIVDDPDINRERGDAHLDCPSPTLSNLPAKHPGA